MEECGLEASHSGCNGTVVRDQACCIGDSAGGDAGNKGFASGGLSVSSGSEFEGADSDEKECVMLLHLQNGESGVVIEKIIGAVKNGESGSVFRSADEVPSLLPLNHANGVKDKVPFGITVQGHDATIERFRDENGGSIEKSKSPFEIQELKAESSKNMDLMPDQSNIAAESNGESNLCSTETSSESCEGSDKVEAADALECEVVKDSNIVGTCKLEDVVGNTLCLEPSRGPIEVTVSFTRALDSDPDFGEAVELDQNSSIDNGSADVGSSEMIPHELKDRESDGVNLLSEVVENSVEEEEKLNLGSTVNQISDAEISGQGSPLESNGELVDTTDHDEAGTSNVCNGSLEVNRHQMSAEAQSDVSAAFILLDTNSEGTAASSSPHAPDNHQPRDFAISCISVPEDDSSNSSTTKTTGDLVMECLSEPIIQSNGFVEVPHENMESGMNPTMNGRAPHFLQAVLNGRKKGTSEEEGPSSNGFLRFSSNEAARSEPSPDHLLSRDNLAENFPTIYESYPQAEFTSIKFRSAMAPPPEEVNDENISHSGSSEKTVEEEDHVLPREEGDIVEVEDSDGVVQFEDSNGDCNLKMIFPNNNGETADVRPIEEDVSEVASEINKPFNFLVRIPRSDDESNREEIKLAKDHVDEKTKIRDAVQRKLQQKRASCRIHAMDYEYAMDEAKNARKLVKLKRMEIASLESVMTIAKNAVTVEDIDAQIRNMESMIQHETLHLKEEKELIKQIKKLKQLREPLSSTLHNQDAIKQALEQREDIEERLKILKKELDNLKDAIFQAEAASQEAWKKHENENKEIKELQSQFKAADDVRQEAYARLQSCRKDQSKKNQPFFKYKDDAARAADYAYSGNSRALHRLCLDRVKNFMEIWNTNEEFRREYVRLNSRSTVRRFGNLDSRSLGPDEKPVVFPSFSAAPKPVISSDQGPLNSTPSSSSSHQEAARAATAESTKMESAGEISRPRPPPPVRGNTTEATATITCIINEVVLHEEVEAQRKAEETRKEEAEGKLKEQKRSEELEKAKEARERKKKQLEKLQIREKLKTQKEAEHKEKEREKRQRKKERKKAHESSENNTTASEVSSSTTACMEIESIPSSSSSSRKQPKKHAKAAKPALLPPPALRNRNRKKWQQWIWFLITCLSVVIVFWLGNIGFFANVNVKQQSNGRR